MDISMYQKESIKTTVDLDSFEQRKCNSEDVLKAHLLNASVGISVESTEVLQHIQRYVFCGKSLDKDHVLDECGDVLWYINYILSKLGLSLEECMKQSLIKVSKKYPERFSK